MAELFDKTDAEPMVVALGDLTNGQEGDFFALLAEKTQLTTKDGKPYWRVTFRDARRDVNFPVWSDAPLFPKCNEEWQVGEFYKLRALYHETAYGPQLDIRLIRAVEEADQEDGFDPTMCQPRSRFDLEEMFNDLRAMCEEKIEEGPLRTLSLGLLDEHREELLLWPAASRNHHAFVGGYLEHVRNVATNAVMLAQRYAELYPDMQPPLNIGLVTAGAVLHDIGKLRELRNSPVGAEYTAAGSLIGHILQGRDMIREAAAQLEEPLDEETLLRLEHIIVSHQRLPEWGSPKPPMTIEALLVHYADDTDAKLQMMMTILREGEGTGPVTNRRNVLGQGVYRGGE